MIIPDTNNQLLIEVLIGFMFFNQNYFIAP